jgi:hypothetical protein
MSLPGLFPGTSSSAESQWREREREGEGTSHPESALSATEHARVGCDSSSESVLCLMERLLGAHALPSLACYCGCTYLEEFLEDHKSWLLCGRRRRRSDSETFSFPEQYLYV